MKTQTPRKPQYKSRGDREGFKREEKPPFVPRYIGVKFMEIKGVVNVKPSVSNEKEIEIIVIPEKGGYNHALQDRILMVEAEIQEALRSRRQKFYASISW